MRTETRLPETTSAAASESASSSTRRYDPARGQYGFAIMTVIRVLGTATVLLIVLAIVRMIRRDRTGEEARAI